jgi:hypothetical protein
LTTFSNRGAERSLRHSVARADQRRVWQQFDAEALLAFARRQDQLFGVLGQRHRVERHLQQRAVVGRVADQDRAQQLLAVFRDHQLLVDAGRLVCEYVVERPGGVAVRVADGADVDAHELELGAHVGAEELQLRFPEHVACGDLGHLVAGGHQPEGASFP